MTEEEIIESRKINSLLHFTTNRGIVGVLASGELLSRHRLPQEKYLEYVLHVNAASRPEAASHFDKSQNWLDYVNLSITEINKRFLDVSKRWHNNADVWWGILEFDAEVMTHDGVVFVTTNNGYNLCTRAAGPEGLEALFASVVSRKPGWSVARRARPANLPTCEQAEVLYPKAVPVDFLRRIYVEEDDHHDQASGWLHEFGYEDIEVVLSPQKFLGMPN